jgi:Ankyrin repeat
MASLWSQFAGQLEAVRLLLQADASTDVAVEGSPPLHAAVVIAAQPGRADFAAAAMQLLLQAGADATQRCATSVAYVEGPIRCFGVVTLHTARPPVLERGPPKPARASFRRDDQDRTALHWAAELGLDSLVEALLLAYAAAALRAEEGAAVLRRAAEAAGAPPEELAALGGGALPAAAEAQDRQGCTPLHLAAARGHCAALAVLLTGRSPFMQQCCLAS